MRMHLVVVGGAAVALVLAAFAWRPPSPAAGADRARDAAELEALRSETAQLRAAVVELQEQARQRTPATETADRDLAQRVLTARQAEAQDPAVAAPGEPDPERERRDALEYVRYLDDQLAGHPSADAAELAASLTEQLRGFLEEGAAIVDVRCGAQMCRAETRHENSEAYRGFQARGFRQDEERLWTGPSTFILRERPEGPDDPLVAIMYLGRGEALPSPEPPR